jgi:kynurenine 3-monooxygenase
VWVYERRSDPRAAGAAGGRSINLAISTRGIHALRGVGLADTVLDQAIAMRGRMIHAPAGHLALQPYGTRPQDVINSVSRSGLNALLLDHAERHEGVHVCFDMKLTDVSLDDGFLTFEDTRNGRTLSVESEVIVGADGAYSSVRGAMQRLDRFDYQQSYLEYGYKELSVPPAGGGGFRMEPHALHIWPRGGYMMIALPNRDGSFTCTLFWPFDGPTSFAAVPDGAAAVRFFGQQFPDAVALIPTLREDFDQNPTSSLVTIRSGPWYHRDRAVLLGDACHAVVPFYGQGANAAFEDCTILAACLHEAGPDVEAAFRAYYDRRKADVDALADLAIANFREMRDHVGSRWFRVGKHVEKGIHRLFPKTFVPLYTMVTFSRTPYAQAVRRARRQWDAVKAAGVALLLILLALILGWVWS